MIEQSSFQNQDSENEEPGQVLSGNIPWPDDEKVQKDEKSEQTSQADDEMIPCPDAEEPLGEEDEQGEISENMMSNIPSEDSLIKKAISASQKFDAKLGRQIVHRQKEVFELWLRPPGLLPVLRLTNQNWISAQCLLFFGPPNELPEDWGKRFWDSWQEKVVEAGGWFAFCLLRTGTFDNEIYIDASVCAFGGQSLDREKLIQGFKELGTTELYDDELSYMSVSDLWDDIFRCALTPQFPDDEEVWRKYVRFPWAAAFVPRKTPLIPEKGMTYSAKGDKIVDIVDDSGRLGYVILVDRGLICKDCIDNAYPPPREALPYCIPSLAQVFYWFMVDKNRPDSDNKIFYDLVKFFKKVSYLPTENHYYLLAWWAIHTYLYERFNISPILVFYAVPERGKSRIGRALASVSYRGVETETLREANLFRWSQDLGATIFLDVKDIWKKAEKNESEDVLLKRFEQGAKVARVLYPEKGAFKDTRYFDIFGPTIIATNEPVRFILRTRCIVVSMPEAPEPGKLLSEVTREMGLPFRERLVAFRARHMNEALPEFTKLSLGRFGDITQALGRIMRLVSPELENNFGELMRYLWQEKMEEQANTPAAKVVLAIKKAVQAASQTSDLTGVIEIQLAKVVEILNNPKEFSPVKVGKLVKALGFEKRRKSGGQSILVDPKLLRQLEVKYGLAMPDMWEKTLTTEERSSQTTPESSGSEEEHDDRRVDHCWSCKRALDSDVDQKCETCGWMICPDCGACKQGCERKGDGNTEF